LPFKEACCLFTYRETNICFLNKEIYCFETSHSTYEEVSSEVGSPSSAFVITSQTLQAHTHNGTMWIPHQTDGNPVITDLVSLKTSLTVQRILKLYQVNSPTCANMLKNIRAECEDLRPEEEWGYNLLTIYIGDLDVISCLSFFTSWQGPHQPLLVRVFWLTVSFNSSSVMHPVHRPAITPSAFQQHMKAIPSSRIN